MNMPFATERIQTDGDCFIRSFASLSLSFRKSTAKSRWATGVTIVRFIPTLGS
ncbi:hypothetical protein [Paenibacillus sp. MER TA 81-3]|uniref:hypothetical protein n=1 Tax=Paenibacillus sp. MER TA 81-3 TaxID=2939573 RepID=UPI00203A47D6|nr:hypothetical protein [Paenibacillus sp. MER TA 81-3]